MSKIWRAIFIILLLLYLDIGLTPPSAQAQDAPEPVVVEANEKGITLIWTPPAYHLTQVEEGGETFSEIRMAGTTPSARPGYPELPLYSSLIGLPATGGARLHLVELEQETVPLAYPPLPAPAPQPVRSDFLDPSVPLTGGPIRRWPDPLVYKDNAFYPTTVAELGPVQQMRQHRLARLTLNPLRINPVSGQMEVVRRLRLEITFEQPAEKTAASLNDPILSPSFATALASTLINPEASRWPVPSSPAPKTGTNLSLSGSSPVKITVKEAGLYQLTYADLQGVGLPVETLDPRRLHLSHGWPRQEIAMEIEGENDGVFHPGDRLLFYAEPQFSRFVETDVYFLSYEPSAGLRMGSRSGAPSGKPAGTAWHTVTAEANQYYDPLYQGRDGDYWYWDELRRPDRTAATYSIPLNSPSNSGPQAKLTLWLRGYTQPHQNPDHRVAVSVNGLAVGEQIWDGAQAIEASFAVPAARLNGGPNQVALSLPGLSGVTVEGVWFDAMRLTYPIQQGGSTPLIFQGEAGPKAYTLSGWPSANLKVYDISDPTRPRRLSGYNLVSNGASYTLTLGDTDTTPARYLLVPNNQAASPLSLKRAKLISPPPGGADYIIITHPNFAGAIGPLAAHRTAQGLRVATVDVEAIYDHYGTGRMDPAAIKTFLHSAYTIWAGPAPTYVLLAGDGSYDFKDYSGYQSKNFIPPYMAEVDPWWGETASDHQFVTLAGDDPLPEMLIGRLAVNTPAEVETAVDKIIRYETDFTPGIWNARQLFVADNPDSAGDFHAEAELGYDQVKAPFTGWRFYYSPSPGSESYLYTDPVALRTSFLNVFRQGAGMVTFYGHSSWLQWAVEGIFRYHWSPDPADNDLVTLDNQYRLPVVLEMTCFTSSFHRPEYATLDESLVRWPGGGAIATWGSTGLGVSTGHTLLQQGFYQAATGPEQKRLGAAALAGKLKLYSTGFHLDLLDTFTLLGDPALEFNLTVNPPSYHLYLPQVRR